MTPLFFYEFSVEIQRGKFFFSLSRVCSINTCGDSACLITIPALIRKPRGWNREMITEHM